MKDLSQLVVKNYTRSSSRSLSHYHEFIYMSHTVDDYIKNSSSSNEI
jgi:hypothetical protein